MRKRSEESLKTAREEIVILLFRELSLHQQRETIEKLRALVDANRITHSHLAGKPLRTISNEQVRALFGDVPAPEKKRPKKKKGPSRGPGDEMGDYPE